MTSISVEYNFAKLTINKNQVFIDTSLMNTDQMNQIFEKKPVIQMEPMMTPGLHINGSSIGDQNKTIPMNNNKSNAKIGGNSKLVLNDISEDNRQTKNTNKAKRKPKSKSLANNCLASAKKLKSESKPLVDNNLNINLCQKKNKENKNNDRLEISRVIGLPNMGNTCYVNSIIQVLRITPGFKQFVCSLNKLVDSHKNANQLKTSNKQLVKTLHSVFVNFGDNQISDDKTNSYSKNELKITELIGCQDLKNRFEFGQQQDCHEFLSWLIAELNSYVEIILKTNNYSNVKSNYNTRRKSTDFQLNPSFQNFAGVMLRKITCSECQSCSDTHDSFADIQIPLCVYEEEMTDVTDLQTFTQIIHRKDYLKDDNKFDCRKCLKKTNASVVSCIEALPKVMVIFLKKPLEYNQITTRNSKPLKKLFRVPEKLEYQSQLLTKQIQYFLYALVIHNGSDIDNGHYYSIVNSESVRIPNRRKIDCNCALNVAAYNGWIRVNDQKVAKISDNYLKKLLDEQTIASTPYLAFYHRIN